MGQTNVHAVDKAIREANLGLNPIVEGTLLRIPIPELNAERRQELVKVAHKYAEAARVAVRHVRRDALDAIKKQEKDGDIGQDQAHADGEKVQTMTDGTISDIDRDPGRQRGRDHAGLGAKERERHEPARRSETGRSAAPQTIAVPRHVAIIMDGNGRWATARGLPRGEGHRRGVEAVRQTVRAAIDLKIRYLTLYSFSSENWRRPRDEIDFLFGLFRHYIRRDVAELHAQGVRVSMIGSREGVPTDILRDDRGGRGADRRQPYAPSDLRLQLRRPQRARPRHARDRRRGRGRAGSTRPKIDEETIASQLDTASFPDPDLVIRTGREIRLSNFLLWQSAYAELIFLEVNWPDFGRDALVAALETFASRSRRYGGRGATGERVSVARIADGGVLPVSRNEMLVRFASADDSRRSGAGCHLVRRLGRGARGIGGSGRGAARMDRADRRQDRAGADLHRHAGGQLRAASPLAMPGWPWGWPRWRWSWPWRWRASRGRPQASPMPRCSASACCC